MMTEAEKMVWAAAFALYATPNIGPAYHAGLHADRAVERFRKLKLQPPGLGTLFARLMEIPSDAT